MKLPQTEEHMSTIKKISQICVVLCLLLSTVLSTAALAADQYLVTLLLIPDKNIEYTDYDSAYLTIVNNSTGQSYHFTLYPYNNFSNKVLLDAGEYSVLDAGLNGFYDRIFEVEAEDVKVDKATDIIVALKDSEIMQTTTTTKKNTQASTSAQPTTQSSVEPSTLFSIPTGDESTNPSEGNITTSTHDYSTITTQIQPTTPNSLLETTTQSSSIIKEKPAIVIPIIILIALALVVLAFFYVLYKKNKAEE